MDMAQFGQNRYHRQMLLPMIGAQGQTRLGRGRVLLVGCGALGTVMADLLARAGVGHLRIVDRDLVEPTNLQRQTLFDEQDVAEGLPKAIAAQRRLMEINSQVAVDAQVIDVHAGNVEELIFAGIEESAGNRSRMPNCDLILDATDNVETRYLVNDVAVKHGIPWVYGAVVGTEGRMMVIRPGQGPCLRCVFPSPPGPGELATCDTAGVLGPAVSVVASMQAAEAIKLLVGDQASVSEQMLVVDLWSNHLRMVTMREARRAECLCCGRRRFEFLDAPGGGATTSLCGRNAVQIRPARAERLDLNKLADRLSPVGRVERTPFLVRCELHDPAGLHLVVFPDGRLVVQGTADSSLARSVASRFVGL